MSATPVLERLSLTEEIRHILSSCQYAVTAGEYAGQLTAAVAAATESACAIWLDGPPQAPRVAALTGSAPALHLISLCAGAPLIDHQCGGEAGVHSIAAAPVMFRSSPAGVLAVANGARRYTAADLQLLAFIGRTALLEYEAREQAEELEMKTMARRVADLAHDLRQPLGILEACACVLELVLPQSEARAHGHLQQMQGQIDLAGAILGSAVQSYAPRLDCSRDLANPAISMLT